MTQPQLDATGSKCHIAAGALRLARNGVVVFMDPGIEKHDERLCVLDQLSLAGAKAIQLVSPDSIQTNTSRKAE